MISEGDTDSVILKLSKDLLVSLECKENVRSLFPLDYFSNMIRAIPVRHGGHHEPGQRLPGEAGVLHRRWARAP